MKNWVEWANLFARVFSSCFMSSCFTFRSQMPNTFGAIIAGTGSSLPERRLTNDDLSKMVETNDEWITQRTGIKERRIAGKDESTATFASAAARKALDAAGLTPADLDLIICATVTPEMVFPSTA